MIALVTEAVPIMPSEDLERCALAGDMAAWDALIRRHDRRVPRAGRCSEGRRGGRRGPGALPGQRPGPGTLPGATPPVTRAAFARRGRPRHEQHAAACEECAARLAAEARLEEQLHELAAQEGTRTVNRRRPRWALRLAGVGAVAMGAAAALLLLSVRGYPQPVPPVDVFPVEHSRAVICLHDLERCTAAAQARGLLVQYPSLSAVPRYEAGLLLPPQSHGARAPLPL